VVRNVRDGMADLPATDTASRTRVQSHECGNGVVIQHDNDWETQYCHLRRGSVQVKPGDRVARGASIGLVGLSGATEFPHLHLTVRHRGTAIDPFTGQAGSAGCGLAGTPLWRNDRPVSDEPVALYNAGFTGGQPDADRIRRGEPDASPPGATSPALVFWVDMLGVQAGDTVRVTVTAPSGERVMEHQHRLDRTQARRFVFAGRRKTAGRWPPGTYQGEAVLIRGAQGPVLERRITRTVTIED
jgi:Peptidase family M23